MSKETCIICGKPGKIIDNGWVLPLCEKCEEDGWK